LERRPARLKKSLQAKELRPQGSVPRPPLLPALNDKLADVSEDSDDGANGDWQ
jgi:hypothetical protein